MIGETSGNRDLVQDGGPITTRPPAPTTAPGAEAAEAATKPTIPEEATMPARAVMPHATTRRTSASKILLRLNLVRKLL